MIQKTTQETHEAAAQLLLSVWRDMDADFKSRHRREIWRIFEDATRVSANQSGSLVKFVSALSRRVQAGLGRNEKARETLMRVVDSGKDKALLRAFRTDTPYVVMLVRFEMEKLKAQWQQEDEVLSAVEDAQ